MNSGSRSLIPFHFIFSHLLFTFVSFVSTICLFLYRHSISRRTLSAGGGRRYRVHAGPWPLWMTVSSSLAICTGETVSLPWLWLIRPASYCLSSLVFTFRRPLHRSEPHQQAGSQPPDSDASFYLRSCRSEGLPHVIFASVGWVLHLFPVRWWRWCKEFSSSLRIKRYSVSYTRVGVALNANARRGFRWWVTSLFFV